MYTQVKVLIRMNMYRIGQEKLNTLTEEEQKAYTE